MIRIRAAAAVASAAAAIVFGAAGVAASSHVQDVNEDHVGITVAGDTAEHSSTTAQSRLEELNDDSRGADDAAVTLTGTTAPSAPDASGTDHESSTGAAHESQHSGGTTSHTESQAESASATGTEPTETETETETESHSTQTETESHSSSSSATTTETEHSGSTSTSGGGSGSGSGRRP